MKVFGSRRSDDRPVPPEELLKVARKLFGTRGFRRVTHETLAVALDVDVDQARTLAPDLAQLFEAVHQRVQAEVAEFVGGRLSAERPGEILRQGIAAWLDVCADPENVQILVIDPRVALGWERWRHLGDEYGTLLIDAAIADAMDKGAIPEQPVRPLAFVIVGALEEGAIWASRQPDPALAREQIRGSLDQLLRNIMGG